MNHDLSMLYLLQPDQLPQSRYDIHQTLSAKACQALSYGSVTTTTTPDVSDSQLIASLHHILHLLPFPQPHEKKEMQQQTPIERRWAEHDAYSNIERISGYSADIFLRGIVQTYAATLEEVLTVGTSLDTLSWNRLQQAFQMLLHYLFPTGASQEMHSPPSLAIHLRREIDGLLRWRLGHQIFDMLVQGLLVALNCFATLIHDEEFSQAQEALELATTLMWGSGSALRLASDFPVQEYMANVYPSMLPPAVEPGFSGAQSKDHHYLLKSLVNLKPVLTQLDPLLRPAHENFVLALSETYESHKFVCSHFQGDQRGSIRMNHNSAEKSAVDVLEHLRYTRLRHISI